MSDTVDSIKCRERLGKLTSFGIEASRPIRGPGDADGPEALLISGDGRAWLVAIWAGTSIQPQLFHDEQSGSAPSFESVVERLSCWRHSHVSQKAGPKPGMAILAPRLPDLRVSTSEWLPGRGRMTLIPGKFCGKPDKLANAILSQIGEVLDAESLAGWRAAVVPEVKIEEPRPRRCVVRETGATATPLLLDYRQERCVRLDLEPGREVEGVAVDLKVRLVTGVAGCGKTLVLLHRAALLTSRFPQAQVLLVTQNRPLSCDLWRRLQRAGLEKRVECQTFHQWLVHLSPPRGRFMSPVEVWHWIERERREANFAALAKIRKEWIAEEMAWMCDHGFADERYLEVVRKGRVTRLSKRQRQEMLLMLGRYRKFLRETNREDWSEFPLRVSEEEPPALQNRMVDHLLIDEAQFFSPVWLRLLRATLKPGGHLFLCADPTQGFLRRRMAWSELGIDVRKRTHRLEKPYRSTRAIMEFAREFYLRRLPEDEEPSNLPAPEFLEALDTGSAPMVQPVGSSQDQIAQLGNELGALFDQGVPPSDVLVLVAGRKIAAQAVVDHLRRKLGNQSAFLVKNRAVSTRSAGVAHLMAATGLERPIVFLLGLDELMAEELDPSLSLEERKEKGQEHTRLIYVGLTRAMERLVIYACHPDLLKSFGEEETQHARCA